MELDSEITEERLIEFGEEHNLVISNTLFKKALNSYWTWESLGAIAKKFD